MTKYYEIIEFKELSKVAVNYVGIHPVKWGKAQYPQVGFRESFIGRHKKKWHKIAWRYKQRYLEAEDRCYMEGIKKRALRAVLLDLMAAADSLRHHSSTSSVIVGAEYVRAKNKAREVVEECYDK